MSELELVLIGGLIAIIASIIGAYLGAVLGSRYEAATRLQYRPKPIINDIWLWLEDDRTAVLEIKNIGRSSARCCTIEEVLFDENTVILRREFWKEDNDCGKDIHPMQPIDIPWIGYNSHSKTLTFPTNTGEKTYSLNELSFPITGRISLYAFDSESDYYEYRIRLRNGAPYIQTGTNRKHAGPRLPESAFDDKL